MTRLILVRHAITNDNIDGNLSGHIDSQISELGQVQILKLREFLKDEKIDVIYTTTSSRTKLTVEDLANIRNLKIHQCEEFKEINFGDFEGVSFDIIKKNYLEEFNKMIELGYEYRYPNGESLIDSYNRVCKQIDNIISMNKNESILICAHAGTIRNIISYLIGRTHEYHWNFKIDNASISIIDIVDGFSVVETLNNISYLN